MRVCNFYVDVTHASWEIRDSKMLPVYKIAVRNCNFRVADFGLAFYRVRKSDGLPDSLVVESESPMDFRTSFLSSPKVRFPYFFRLADQEFEILFCSLKHAQQ